MSKEESDVQEVWDQIYSMITTMPNIKDADIEGGDSGDTKGYRRLLVSCRGDGSAARRMPSRLPVPLLQQGNGAFPEHCGMQQIQAARTALCGAFSLLSFQSVQLALPRQEK